MFLVTNENMGLCLYMDQFIWMNIKIWKPKHLLVENQVTRPVQMPNAQAKFEADE